MKPNSHRLANLYTMCVRCRGRTAVCVVCVGTPGCGLLRSTYVSGIAGLAAPPFVNYNKIHYLLCFATTEGAALLDGNT